MRVNLKNQNMVQYKKQLVADLRLCKDLDFIFKEEAIKRASMANRHFRKMYSQFLNDGGNPVEWGVIIGHNTILGKDQYFIVPKEFCTVLAETYGKLQTEMTGAQRMMFKDDAPGSIDPNEWHDH